LVNAASPPLERHQRDPVKSLPPNNYSYRNPSSINPQEFANREDEGVLLVPKAGEMLYHLKQQPKWADTQYTAGGVLPARSLPSVVGCDSFRPQ
jgi:hypothetical protein